MNSIIKGIFICIFLQTVFQPLHAQTIKDPDSLFSLARKAAFDDKNYPLAISYAKTAIGITPQYTDIIVFLGSLYAWNKQADSSRYYFDLALKQKPAFEEAYIAYADLELWNNNDSAAFAILNKGLSYVPASTRLLFKKALVFEKQKNYKAAVLLADSVLMLDNKNTEARALAFRIRDYTASNKIGLKYDYVYFDKQYADPWHLASIDYTRQTKAGSFTARLNYANRFNQDALQYELEAYPILSKTFYAYVSAGYSDDVGVFPQWRFGASLFVNLPHAFEAEGGIRYLYFTSSTNTYTAYLGKYYRKFLFGARAYITPSEKNISESYNLSTRYFYAGVDDYIHVNLVYGISPDDRAIAYQLNNVVKLYTYKGEIIFRKAIQKLNIITANVSVMNQEYLPGVKGNAIQAGIGYIRRF